MASKNPTRAYLITDGRGRSIYEVDRAKAEREVEAINRTRTNTHPVKLIPVDVILPADVAPVSTTVYRLRHKGGEFVDLGRLIRLGQAKPLPLNAADVLGRVDAPLTKGQAVERKARFDRFVAAHTEIRVVPPSPYAPNGWREALDVPAKAPAVPAKPPKASAEGEGPHKKPRTVGEIVAAEARKARASAHEVASKAEHLADLAKAYEVAKARAKALHADEGARKNADAARKRLARYRKSVSK